MGDNVDDVKYVCEIEVKIEKCAIFVFNKWNKLNWREINSSICDFIRFDLNIENIYDATVRRCHENS